MMFNNQFIGTKTEIPITATFYTLIFGGTVAVISSVNTALPRGTAFVLVRPPLVAKGLMMEQRGVRKVLLLEETMSLASGLKNRNDPKELSLLSPFYIIIPGWKRTTVK